MLFSGGDVSTFNQLKRAKVAFPMSRFDHPLRIRRIELKKPSGKIPVRRPIFFSALPVLVNIGMIARPVGTLRVGIDTRGVVRLLTQSDRRGAIGLRDCLPRHFFIAIATVEFVFPNGVHDRCPSRSAILRERRQIVLRSIILQCAIINPAHHVEPADTAQILSQISHHESNQLFSLLLLELRFVACLECYGCHDGHT